MPNPTTFSPPFLSDPRTPVAVSSTMCVPPNVYGTAMPLQCLCVRLKSEFSLYRKTPENAIIYGVFQGDFVLIGLSAERGKRDRTE